MQFGGQTPLNLARALEAAGVPIIGTSVEIIDMAEDRERFQALDRAAGPEAAAQRHGHGPAAGACAIARRIGYPVLVRPSYVLGGRAMEIVYDEAALSALHRPRPSRSSPGKPVLIDKFLETPSRSTSTASCDGKRTIIGGVMQHIEEAGIHSGDSACVIPPHSLPADGRRGDQASRRARWPRR